MQLRADIQLASIMKSMTDVVIPAIDPANTLACEQSRLIVGLLALMARQLPLQFDFDRDELARLIECAEAVSRVPLTHPAGQAAQATLAAACHAANDVQAACRLSPATLTEAVRSVRAALGALVATLATAESGGEAQQRIERLVLGMSQAQLLRDRALLKQQGWEPDPTSVPDIEALLDAAPFLPDMKRDQT